jgi:IS5 family transposase
MRIPDLRRHILPRLDHACFDDLDLTRRWARLLEQAEQLKASVRAMVEHPFHLVKNLFRHKKVRYKGLAKNDAQLFKQFGAGQPGHRKWRCAIH